MTKSAERLKSPVEKVPTLEPKPPDSPVSKEKVKRWYDRRLSPKAFEPGHQVLLFNSRLRLFPGKLKSRWSGPFTVKTVFPHGAVEIYDKSPDESFKVNGQRLKIYYGGAIDRQSVSIILADV